MSLHAKIELAGGINLFLWRHGGAGRAWRVASLESNSHDCCGSLKDTLTSLASFLASSFPGTANSSLHQSGVSHLSAFHGTHRPKSRIWAPEASPCPLHPKSLATLAGRKLPLVSAPVVPPSQSLCPWTPLHLVASWGWQIG